MKHLKVVRGRSETDLPRVLKMMARFICWLQSVMQPEQRKFNCLVLLKKLLAKNHNLLEMFVLHLENDKLAKPATIANYITEIKGLLTWLLNASPMPHTSADIQALYPVVELLQGLRAGQAKKVKATKNQHTFANRVKTMRMPEGGFQAVLACVDNATGQMHKWAREVEECCSEFSEKEYNYFLGVLISSLYVYAPQGRIGGVESLKYPALREMLARGHTSATEFKTAAHHRFQAVTVTEQNRELLAFYGRYLRPRVATSAPLDSSFLWLRYDGRQFARLGRVVSRFFKLSPLGLKMGTTSLRALMETVADELASAGAITLAQQRAVTRLNNHSGAVAENHYIMRNGDRDVSTARSVMDVIFARSPVPLTHASQMRETPDEALQDTAPPEVIFPRELGIDHPSYANPLARRVPWTDKEIDYVGQWLDQYRLKHPNGYNAVAKCRDHILADPDAMRLFHKNHVLDSQRLDHARKMYLQRK